MYLTSDKRVTLLERPYGSIQETSVREETYGHLGPMTGRDIEEIIEKSKVSPTSYRQPSGE
ncbi:MAG: hypothetical protein QXI33_03175 [Candidatus Pacearchaeota archaeon]